MGEKSYVKAEREIRRVAKNISMEIIQSVRDHVLSGKFFGGRYIVLEDEGDPKSSAKCGCFYGTIWILTAPEDQKSLHVSEREDIIRERFDLHDWSRTSLEMVVYHIGKTGGEADGDRKWLLEQLDAILAEHQNGSDGR